MKLDEIETGTEQERNRNAIGQVTNDTCYRDLCRISSKQHRFKPNKRNIYILMQCFKWSMKLLNLENTWQVQLHILKVPPGVTTPTVGAGGTAGLRGGWDESGLGTQDGRGTTLLLTHEVAALEHT